MIQKTPRHMNSISHFNPNATALPVSMDAAAVHIVSEDILFLRGLTRPLQTAGVQAATYNNLLDLRQSLASQTRSKAFVSCVVLDINQPGSEDVEILQTRFADCFAWPVVLLIGSHDVQMAVDAMRNGAFDVVAKPIQPNRLIQRIRSALVCGSKLGTKYERRQTLQTRLKTLSRRESETFEMLGKAMSVKEIAAAMGIGVQTAGKHRANVLKKLRLRNDIELGTLAVELNLADPCPRCSDRHGELFDGRERIGAPHFTSTTTASHRELTAKRPVNRHRN